MKLFSSCGCFGFLRLHSRSSDLEEPEDTKALRKLQATSSQASNLSSTANASWQTSNVASQSDVQLMSNRSLNPLEAEEDPGMSVHRLTLKECHAITRKFTTDVIGQGSYGTVYRCKWEVDGVMTAVAVKRMHERGISGQEQWLNEVILLAQLQHPHLIRLLAYCMEGGETALVYELCPNGSLADALFSENGWRKKLLTWQDRVRIVQEIASALAFLHSSNIIHRDLKADNVCLAEDLSARITDLGMARSGPEGRKTHVSTRVQGSMGYIDPSYMETGHLSKASDVYSFGVMLLESLTGSPATDLKGRMLVIRLWPMLRTLKVDRSSGQPVQDITPLMDPSVVGQWGSQHAAALFLLARECVAEERASRPSMQAVCDTLSAINKALGRREGASKG